METIETLDPCIFRKLIVTVGELPSSFVESMSYYECVAWLVAYIRDNVVPTVNTQSAAIKEIQEWIETLDLQDEVDNKLDEMAESGELAEIISQYLNSTAIFGYDTVADMQSADNLIDGSYARTLGYYAKNDGGAGLYKIRTITNEDVVDNGSIIAMDNNTLIAELIIEGTINFKQFGAKGDGTTNDYQAIANCCSYANDNHLLIYNETGSYYIDGNQIALSTSVKNNEGVTFIIGTSYSRYNSLFVYNHDSTTNVTGVALSTVFTDKSTLNNTYSGKSFVLDTKIKYGQRLDGPDANNTILEPFYCTKTREYLWSIDYDGDRTVDLINVSDSFEEGYTFDGGIIEQYDTTGYGVSFLTIGRNNCTVKNIDIRCENTTGSNAVIHVDYGNNVTLENIFCNSQNSGTGSYNISLENTSNVITRHITGNNNSNTFGNRTVKNWILENSKTTLWDIHWNAFGLLTIDNVEMTGSASIGYGTGIFTVKNSYIGGFITTAQNYSPIYNGEIHVENSAVDDGVHIQRTYTSDATRDEFFDDMIMPTVTIKGGPRKVSSSKSDLYVNIPADAAALLTEAGTVIFDNVNLRRIYYSQQSTATTPVYNLVFRDCKNVSSNVMNTAKALGTPVGEGMSSFTTTAEATPQSGAFTDGTFTSSCIKDGNSVFVKCTGTLANALGNNATIVSAIPNGYISTINTYGYIYYGTTIAPCYVTRFGKIVNNGASIPSGTEISVVANYVL